MKTIELLVSERDYGKYRFRRKKLTLAEIKEQLKQEIFQKAIADSIKIAEETGLSKMTMEEINSEIEKVRKRA